MPPHFGTCIKVDGNEIRRRQWEGGLRQLVLFHKSGPDVALSPKAITCRVCSKGTVYKVDINKNIIIVYVNMNYWA